MRRHSFATVLILATFASGAASAQQRPDPNESQARLQSRAAFRKGVAAAEGQRWVEARDDFERAYELFPHPSILLDLGVSRAHVGEYVQSEQELTRFLAEDIGANAEELQTARTTLADVRKHLGTVRMRVAPAGATAAVDGKPVALVADQSTDVRVMLGAHDVVARAPGHEAWEGRVVVDGPEAKTVSVMLAKSAEPVRHTGLGMQRISSFVVFGAGVAVTSFAIFAGIHALDLANQYNTITEPNYQNPATKSEGIAFRTAADVTFILAAVCAAVGVVLYVTAPQREPTVAITPFGITWRF